VAAKPAPAKRASKPQEKRPTRAAVSRPPVSARDTRGTRERILAAAAEAFAAHGLRGARVQEIVARAGVNERMLYHHFGDKDGLYRAVVESFLTSVAAGIEGALDAPATDPVERLRAILGRYFEAMATHPDIVRVFLHEVLAGWPSQAKMKELRREIDARITTRIFAFFAEAERAGVFREGIDPRVAVLLAGGACLMIPLARPRVEQMFASEDGGPADLGAVQDAMIDTILQGVVAKRSPRR
jgi:TetR/AcrR family transcriptional regulator